MWLQLIAGAAGRPPSLLLPRQGPPYGHTDDQQPESQQLGFTFPAQHSLTPIGSQASHQEKRRIELFSCSHPTHKETWGQLLFYPDLSLHISTKV